MQLGISSSQQFFLLVLLYKENKNCEDFSPALFFPTIHLTIESTEKTQNDFGDKYCPVVSFRQDYRLVKCQSSYLLDL